MSEVSELNEICQRDGFTATWSFERVGGPDHSPTWQCCLVVDGVTTTSDVHPTKRDAKRDCAKLWMQRRSKSQESWDRNVVFLIDAETCYDEWLLVKKYTDDYGGTVKVFARGEWSPPDQPSSAPIIQVASGHDDAVALHMFLHAVAGMNKPEFQKAGTRFVLISGNNFCKTLVETGDASYGGWITHITSFRNA